MSEGWRLIAANPWPAGLLLAVATLAIAAVLFLYRNETTIGSWGWRGLLIAARLLLYALVLLLLMEPVLSRDLPDTRRGIVAVMLDVSESQSLGDLNRPGTWREEVESLAAAGAFGPEAVPNLTRADVMRAALELPASREAIRDLARVGPVKFYAFDEGIELHRSVDLRGRSRDEWEAPLSAEALGLDDLVCDGGSTFLDRNLREVVRRLRPEGLVAVLVLSDGRSTADERFDASDLGVPVYTVRLGDPRPPQDIEVLDLQANEVVLKDDRIALRATVRGAGYDGTTVDVICERDGEEVDRTPLPIGPEPREVAFTDRADRAGTFTYTVRVEPRPEELTDRNNAVAVPVRVVDERIRVLYVEGTSRLEYHYLKNALVRDPSMDVRFMLLDADPDFRSEGNEMVHVFPSDRDLLSGRYDVLILGDIPPADLQRRIEPDRQKLIVEFVEEFFGGVLFIAGHRYGAPQTYRGTPIESILPVETYPRGEVPDALRRPHHTVPYRPRITPDGLTHPVMQFDEDRTRNLEAWGRLPEFFWSYPIRRPVPGAVVLAETDLPSEGPGRPLVVTTSRGKGVTALLATDEFWRWRREFDDERTYRFWSQMIRWLARGRFYNKDKRFRLVVSPEREVSLREEVLLRATVLDANLEPTREESTAVVVRDPDGKERKVDLAADPDSRGGYRGTWRPQREGTYTLWLEQEALVNPQDVLRFELRVVRPVREYLDPTADAERLDRIARESGGRTGTVAEVPELLAGLDEHRLKETVQEHKSIGNSPWFFAAFLVLIAGEWILRRRHRAL